MMRLILIYIFTGTIYVDDFFTQNWHTRILIKQNAQISISCVNVVMCSKIFNLSLK